MTTNKHKNDVIQAYHNGRLNEYMKDRLLHINDSGMSDSLSEELIQDAQDASDLGVNSDKDYNVYFFIGHLTDDVLDDTFGTKLDSLKRKDLAQYLFDNRNSQDYKLNDLVDFRLLIHKWLCDRLSKKAYPNTLGKMNREPISNIDKWISTLKSIYGAIHMKNISRSDAINYFTADWDKDEKQKFINWLRYYEDGTMEKYNVKNAKLTKEADLGTTLPSFPSSWARPEDRADTTPHMSTFKPQRTQKEIEDERVAREKEREAKEKAKTQAELIGLKTKMRSRLYSLKRLVDRYNNILPKQDIEHILEEMHSLDKKLSKLEVLASVQDCIIRSANRIRKFGFEEGAEILEKTAAEPAVGKDVVQSIPTAISDQPNLPASQTATFNIKTIIDRLEGLSKTLKSRDMIRELASIDILLNELGLASYFPELTDAQSKLIESYGYASNKVESIIAKLRGSGTSKPQPPKAEPPKVAPPTAKPPAAPPVQPPAEPMNTGELMEKPVGEVQRELPKKPE